MSCRLFSDGMSMGETDSFSNISSQAAAAARVAGTELLSFDSNDGSAIAFAEPPTVSGSAGWHGRCFSHRDKPAKPATRETYSVHGCMLA